VRESAGRLLRTRSISSPPGPRRAGHCTPDWGPTAVLAPRVRPRGLCQPRKRLISRASPMARSGLEPGTPTRRATTRPPGRLAASGPARERVRPVRKSWRRYPGTGGSPGKPSLQAGRGRCQPTARIHPPRDGETRTRTGAPRFSGAAQKASNRAESLHRVGFEPRVVERRKSQFADLDEGVQALRSARVPKPLRLSWAPLFRLPAGLAASSRTVSWRSCIAAWPCACVKSSRS
jgi:hypothetical protein